MTHVTFTFAFVARPWCDLFVNGLTFRGMATLAQAQRPVSDALLAVTSLALITLSPCEWNGLSNDALPEQISEATSDAS